MLRVQHTNTLLTYTPSVYVIKGNFIFFKFIYKSCIWYILGYSCVPTNLADNLLLVKMHEFQQIYRPT